MLQANVLQAAARIVQDKREADRRGVLCEPCYVEGLIHGDAAMLCQRCAQVVREQLP